MPEYIAWLQDAVLPKIQALLPSDWVVLDVEHMKEVVADHWRQAGGAGAEFVSRISQSGMTLFGWLANLVLIPVLTFYLLRDWDVLMSRLRELIPRRHEALAVRLAQECDHVLGAFVRGQLSVMLALSVVYALGLLLVGIDGALLIGVVAGLLSFVPYLGFALGIIVAGVTALVQFQDLLHVLLVLAVFGFGQMLESAVLSPYLLGNRIGLHPVAVIFAVMAGGQLFGFVGILLALPVAAVIVVLLRYVHARYRDSELYAGGGKD
jgi:predicted PurR-regulated permease PerM